MSSNQKTQAQPARRLPGETMSVRTKVVWEFAGAVAIALAAAACGGSSGGGGITQPSGGGGTTTTTTITITASGVSPKTITVARGAQVTFVNNDVIPHDMESDPHPEHTDCPQLSQVGFLNPGQSKQSGNLNTARTCGYHDHNNDTNNSLKGSIVIQ
jgi:plastocyanin